MGLEGWDRDGCRGVKQVCVWRGKSVIGVEESSRDRCGGMM